jgi:hypothetical protein
LFGKGRTLQGILDVVRYAKATGNGSQEDFFGQKLGVPVMVDGSFGEIFDRAMELSLRIGNSQRHVLIRFPEAIDASVEGSHRFLSRLRQGRPGDWRCGTCN